MRLEPDQHVFLRLARPARRRARAAAGRRPASERAPGDLHRDVSPIPFT
ncbi:hypothetical protein D8O27_19040 [Burkholderia mallei]|uniref:Uncharacterized protein n=1 Tax=Burkholderia mallei TaxID=13373 RepID=A0AAX1XB78_BURML|nr:hypothetical protein EGY16_16910 [Burkholderia pseudomallei]RKN97669.1 hypothetical protein D8O31_14215 [Burkholderia mallei]AYX34330.1 hypothetical protein EGY15_03465 [Burkholderia pseudomallei]MBM5646748.1 hypothetical protein [Burkholderia pseudomallei]MVZ87341.1 hypothetical protein [Burkholderia pseudomallei]